MDESGSESTKLGEALGDQAGLTMVEEVTESIPHVSARLRGSTPLFSERRRRFSKNKGGRAHLVCLSHPGDSTGEHKLEEKCLFYNLSYFPSVFHNSPPLAKFHVYQQTLFFFKLKVAFCDVNFLFLKSSVWACFIHMQFCFIIVTSTLISLICFNELLV